MSEEIIPDVINTTSDVLEEKVEMSAEQQVETPQELESAEDVLEQVEEEVPEELEAEPVKAAVVNFAEKTLDELIAHLKDLQSDADRMKRSKEVEAVKSAFYKKLLKEKSEGNLSEDKQTSFEEGFKIIYNAYKEERNEYNRQLEKEREENLAVKLGIVEELKALVEKQEDVSATFPAFREIQNKWRAAGPVPAQKFRDVNDTYQYYVEKFYDMVKINRDLRDLDFKKNLEAKQGFCEAAEKLAESDNAISAFKDLQKLHEQWKEFGPVAKEFREDIWNRFKAATATINKKYQAYFESQKEKFGENLAAKEKLCELAEAIADKEVTASSEWNSLSKEIEELQKQWRGIGFAAKKDNQKIYERFRAACDKFFERKRTFYTDFKDNMNSNLDKKMKIVEMAEQLKNSTEWKKATDQFIDLQKQWKEIGAVPRKKSDQLWKRFRAACDEFFAEREKQAKPENDFWANLKAKKKLIAEIYDFEPSEEKSSAAAFEEFNQRWKAIGFVPMKEKENIGQSFREAMSAKFPDAFQKSSRESRRGSQKAPLTENEILIRKYNALQQDIDTYENNIGFFSMTKNAEAFIKQMQQKIEDAKKELKELEEKIRKAENNG